MEWSLGGRGDRSKNAEVAALPAGKRNGGVPDPDRKGERRPSLEPVREVKLGKWDRLNSNTPVPGEWDPFFLGGLTKVHKKKGGSVGRKVKKEAVFEGEKKKA